MLISYLNKKFGNKFIKYTINCCLVNKLNKQCQEKHANIFKEKPLPFFGKKII